MVRSFPHVTSNVARLWTALLVCAVGGGVTSAFGHVTLERNQAPVGASYKAVLRVPHGCDGSPTTAIRIRIPEGVIDVKPMPKPGWTLNVVKGKYAKSYSLFRAQVSEGVTEIDWTGGNLSDDYYDEFVFQTFLAGDLPAGETIYFPVVQECVKGVHRWIEIPKEGADYPEPAPGLKLVPKQ
jgi:periplasmic copper chaperone A